VKPAWLWRLKSPGHTNRLSALSQVCGDLRQGRKGKARHLGLSDISAPGGTGEKFASAITAAARLERNLEVVG
jgi:hypothetical protein